MAIYAMGDLHGRLDLYKQVKEFLQPDDKVIFVGDAGDRGPDPWETIKAVYADPQFIYLMGNHEHMLLKSMYQYHGHEPTFYSNPMNGCFSNGGKPTFDGWVAEGADIKWAERLNNLQLRYEYTNESGIHIIICHSGYTPLLQPMENRAVFDLIWDRDHITDPWPKDKFQDVLIIHGHTPTGLLSKKLDGKSIWYADGHKIDLDTGAVWTGRLCLLDLDTLDEHYFIGKPMEDA